VSCLGKVGLPVCLGIVPAGPPTLRVNSPVFLLHFRLPFFFGPVVVRFFFSFFDASVLVSSCLFSGSPAPGIGFGVSIFG